MSKADGTAFGRPFRPCIAVANSGNKPPYSGLNNIWNSYMEPYYQDWAHPDDGIEFIIYLHVLYWSGFYSNDNVKPSSPTNENDPNYDWSYLDGIEQGVDALRLGKAKLHFRWDTESSGVPDFLEAQGDTFDGTGGRPVPAWHRANVQADARDFWTAFSARYNGSPWLAHISHEEDNPGNNTPGDWTGAGWTSGRANVVRHTYNLLTGHTVFLAQSSGVHEHLEDIPVGKMMDDPKPGFSDCGSSHSGYPVWDCTDGIFRGMQDFNGTIENPPGGLPKPIFISSMPNGWGSRNDGNYGSSNPWGVPYPIPGETSNPAPGTLGDPDWNAAQHISYTSGEPRAPSPLDNSGLGNPGRDNAGVIPSMGVMVHPGNDTAQAWNRAFQLFGKNGTRSAPATPWDWEDGSGGGGGGSGVPFKPWPNLQTTVANTIRVNHLTQGQVQSDIETYYDQWKTDILVDLGTYNGHQMYRIALSKSGANNDITVSEGQGYGMTIVPLMAGYDDDAKTIFDGLYWFYKEYPSSIEPRNMAWRVDHPTTPTGGDDDSAFDGEMAIAYGLMLAHDQWGSNLGIDYRSEGIAIANAMMASEVGAVSNYPLLGDWVGVNTNTGTYNQWCARLSDFDFAIFRAFETFTGSSRWANVRTACASVLSSVVANYSPTHGLVPDFVVPTSASDTTPKPAPADYIEAPTDGDYYYNSVRVPMRLGHWTMLVTDPTLADLAIKLSEFMRLECSGNPSNLLVGYELDGTAITDYASIVQTAPIAVASLKNTTQQAWVNALYDAIRDTHEDYFEDSLCLLSMLALSATHWIPDNGTPPDGGGGGGSGNEVTTSIGFSTTEQWMLPMMEAHPNTNIIAVMVGGGDIDYWNTGTNIADGVEESYSTNSGDKEIGDVIFFQVAGPERSPAQWDAEIEQALTTIRSVFTNLSRITLAASPGGPNGTALCPSNGPNNIDGSVRDSVTYPQITLAISIVAARYTDVDWVHCFCDDCSWYSDGIGHITSTGGALLGEKMWNVLFAGLPPPSEVIAVADTLAGVGKNTGQIQIQNSTLTANDTGDALSITAVSDAQDCTVALDVQNSRISYTPAADFSGDSTFRYTLSGDGGSSETQVTVPVGNQAPVLSPVGTLAVTAGSSIGWNPVGVDPDGDTVTFEIDRQPTEGTMQILSHLPPSSAVFNYEPLITSSGIVTGGQYSCTDSDPVNPLKSAIVDIIFDVTPTPDPFESHTLDEDQAVINGGAWVAPPATVPEFGNIEGQDWQVFRSQAHQDHIAVTAPTNASEGDTLVIVAACDGNMAVDMTMEPSAGWVNRYNRHESGTSLSVFDKVLTDSEPGTYTVRQGGASEEWCAFSLVLPPGSTFDSLGETAGVSTTGQAPSITPITTDVMLLFVVASDDPDDTEDANDFTGNTTMIGNKWSSNTGGMVSLAMGYDTQSVAQATTARNLSLDIDGRWTGLTLAYTQALSGYSGAFGGDALLNSTGDGTGSICYTQTEDAENEKNWLRVYAQWPTNDIASNAVRTTLNVGGVDYAEVSLDQTINGGVMNQIYSITAPLPPGTMTLCIYDNASGSVFADAIRFDYSVGDAGFVTFSKNASGSGHLKLSDTVSMPVDAYILEAGTTLFTFTTSCQANALIVRTQELWATLSLPETEWTTEVNRQ